MTDSLIIYINERTLRISNSNEIIINTIPVIIDILC